VLPTRSAARTPRAAAPSAVMMVIVVTIASSGRGSGTSSTSACPPSRSTACLNASRTGASRSRSGWTTVRFRVCGATESRSSHVSVRLASKRVACKRVRPFPAKRVGAVRDRAAQKSPCPTDRLQRGACFAKHSGRPWTDLAGTPTSTTCHCPGPRDAIVTTITIITAEGAQPGVRAALRLGALRAAGARRAGHRPAGPCG